MAKKKETLSEVRDHLVVKRNDLIQKSRYQMSLQEQKIVLYLISKVKPDDKNFKEQLFSIKEFCLVCGIDDDNGKNYGNIKNTLKTLSDRSIWITLEDGSETTLRWVNKVTINKHSGLIKLQLDEDLKPYLLDLQENFTQYHLIYTLAMQSQYSIRLYELLKSYQFKGCISFDIGELKRLLFAEQYERFPDFKRRVIDMATREINKLTDIQITYELTKEGRKFNEVCFEIHQKDTGERLDTWSSISELIDSTKDEAKKSSK